jgi:RND family efflux transporter MFP subunit
MTSLLRIYKHLKPLSTLGFSIIAVALLGACRSTEPSAIASESKVLPVKLAAVESGMIRDNSEFVANLESRKSVVLQPRVQGQVSRIFVQAGDTVKAGTPIMQIDSREQLAAVESRAREVDSARANAQRARASKQQAKAKVLQSISDLKNAEATFKTLEADRKKALADLKFNQDQYERYQQLHAEGAVSRQMHDQFRNSLDTAKAALLAVEARIQAARAEIESQRSNIAAQQAEVEAQGAEVIGAERQIQYFIANTREQQARLQYYTITAPFDGIVGNIPVKEGNFVNPETNLAKLTQNDALEVNISIPASRSRDIRIGTTIELINAQKQVVGTSRVFFISPNVANNTQSILIKARLDNTRRQLRADEFVRARVIWEQKPGLRIPSIAISRIAGQSFVFVAEQSKTGLVARQRPVRLGNIEGNNYQVLEGLKLGERIAVTGLLQLSDGAAIAPEP